MGKGRTGSARGNATKTGAPPTAAANPFDKLAHLRRTVRAADDKATQATAALRRSTQKSSVPRDLPSGTARADDDSALFRQAVGQVAPIRAQGRVLMETPKPPPVPRPHDRMREAPDPAPITRRGPAAPQTDSELFRTAVGEVTPVRDSGRLRVDHAAAPRYRHPASGTSTGPAHHPDSGEVGEAGKLGAPVLPRLSDTDAPGDMFRRAVGAVEPLPDRNLARIERPLPSPAPRQTEADEEAVLHEAISAPLSFEDRLDMGDEAAFLRDGIARRVLTDLRRGRWVVQAQLDLHGLTREEARDALGHFLAESLQQGYRCLRLIHGKGLGSPGQEPVLKHLSHAWLARREDILAFCQARPQDGGAGALLILLRAPRGDRALSAAAPNA